MADAEEFGHLVIEEAFARFIGLDPLAVENELRDGSLAGVLDDEFGGAGGVLDVDFGVGDLVGLEEALGLTTITTPGS